MSLRALLLLIIGAAIVAFIGVNWTAMTMPTDLNLIFTEIRAPLGLVLLGLMALLSVVFVGLIAYTQGTVLMETRRHAKELTAQRELADKAEASRFTDLRAHLDKEVARLSEVIDNHTRETLARVDRAEMGLRDRPVDLEVGRLVQAVESHNRDLHARVDRLKWACAKVWRVMCPRRPACAPPSPARRCSRRKAPTKTPSGRPCRADRTAAPH